jgi:hypothetical protein
VRWLTDKFVDYRPIPASNPDGGLDYLLSSEGGEIIGVVVKVIRNTTERGRRVRDVVDTVRRLPDYAPSDIWIILVADDQESAQSLDEGLAHRRRDAGSWKVTIGWLDRLLSFVEFSTFRLD